MVRFIPVVVALLLLLAAPARAETVWAVGDGAVPGAADDDLAAFIQGQGIHRFLYLGDVYETGTAEEFATNYDSSFGRFKPVTDPTPGNHEWANRAEGYDVYWAQRAPWQPGGGHWYHLHVGGWHVVSLNSEESIGAGSQQLEWLEAHLAGRGDNCTIVFLHRPRYSAGPSGDSSALEAMWATLSGRAAAVLAGHEHNYQRLAPQRGIVQFVVGTGGREGADDLDTGDTRLVAHDRGRAGALRLDLRPGVADFRFVTSSGATVDSGSVTCGTATQPPPPPPPPPPPGGDQPAPQSGSTVPSPPASVARELDAVLARLTSRLRALGPRRLARRERITLRFPSPADGAVRVRASMRSGWRRITVLDRTVPARRGEEAVVVLRPRARARRSLVRRRAVVLTVSVAAGPYAVRRDIRIGARR